MRFVLALIATMGFWSHSILAEQEPSLDSEAIAAEELAQLSEEEQRYMQWATEMWESLDRQTGIIDIPTAGASLDVPDSFYFLDSEDATKVLVDIWGNPPGQTVLGMLFPAEYTPFDSDSWAVTIEYEEDGYVSDADADKIDYQDLLEGMKKDTRLASEERVKQGYEAIELVGWASPPYYDQASHKLHWAKELNFAGQEQNTLNYNIRVLGRRGVLLMNFIANIDQKTIIDNNVETVLALAEFDQGSRYADFDPEVDKVAAYGIGALVAGKVAAKTGLIAALILFLKKFGVIILVALGALAKVVFRGKKGQA